MLILKPQKLVILTPTGTQAQKIHHCLGDRKGAMIMAASGQTHWSHYHSTSIPDEYLHYRRAVVVRNPFTRALQMYDDHVKQWQEYGKKPKTLLEWVSNIHSNDWRVSMTIADWISDQLPAELIHFEYAARDLKDKFGIKIKSPFVDYINYKSRWWPIGAAAICEYRQHVSADIDRHGYATKAITWLEAKAIAGINDV
jgi:hypothetical protein